MIKNISGVRSGSQVVEPGGKYIAMPKRTGEKFELEKKNADRLNIKVRTNCPKEMLITVYSGMCNRMFLIISAMRLCRMYGHKLTVFWSERTGRYGLPYYGDINSDWDDYFKRIDNVATYGIQGSIKFQDNFVDLDQERSFPENLPVVNGVPYASKEIALMLFGPKTVNVNNNKIIVQKLTKPFGSESDDMKKYMNYVDKIGNHRKDEYLGELSDEAKNFKLIDKLQGIFESTLVNFQKYKEVWGIHLRGTDLAPQTSKDKKAALMQIFQSASNTVGFFIASDEVIPEWVKDKLGDRLIVYDNEVKLENSIEGTQHGLVDLFLLSKCNKLFGTSGSSFSMMAWMLSDLNEYTIHS